MEMPDNSKQAGVLDNVTLTGSRQGKAAGIVDVDGDGISDKVVGAPYAAAAANTGVVLIYKGDSSGGFSSAPTSVLNGDDLLGYSFVKLDKSMKDDAERFAVSSLYGNGDDVSMSGSVSVYQGGSNGPQLVKKISGEGPMDRFGFSIAAGDLDADGYTDIVVGAQYSTQDPLPDPTLYQQGAAYIYFGPDFTRSIALHATSSNKGLGWTVATGDINGDGTADLLISAGGKVMGYYGGTSFAPALDSPDLKITSSSSGFGKAISVIGDIDGDGKGDIAIGAPNAVITANGIASRDTGSVYIIKGGVGPRTVNADNASTDKLAQINGGALFDRFGSSIVPVGDIDNDGKPDFSVSSTLADVNTDDISGQVYLFRGADINSSTTLSNSKAFKGFMIDQSYGTSLAPAGPEKLLIGGPTSDMNTGGVYMVDLITGQVVSGGSTSGGSGGSGGGSTGGGLDCTSMPGMCM